MAVESTVYREELASRIVRNSEKNSNSFTLSHHFLELSEGAIQPKKSSKQWKMEMDIEQNGQPLPLLIENNDIPSIQKIIFQDPDVLTKVVDQSIRLFRFSGSQPDSVFVCSCI